VRDHVKHEYRLLFALVLAAINSYAQIGAEAQGGQFTMWTALGIDQEISKKWLSVTDLGFGRHSDPNNLQVLKRQGLNVVTQDFVYKPNPHWGFAFSFGYWRRNAYEDNTPYDERPVPYSFRNELRPFQRINYYHTIKNINVSHSIRADYRFYYDQNFSDVWTTPFEFRARYMQTWKFPLSKDHKNWFITNDEVLSAIDRYSGVTALVKNANWSPYQITENRLSVYYRRSFVEKRIDIDIGLMHQYWRDKPGVNNFSVSYNLMFDIIIRDPFSRTKPENK
jgi:hypothetical protein